MARATRRSSSVPLILGVLAIVVVVVVGVAVVAGVGFGKGSTSTVDQVQQGVAGQPLPAQEQAGVGNPAVAAAQQAFPTQMTTGVPAGVTLKPHKGDLTLNKPGQVVEGLDIEGSVTFNASNVTLRNCRVRSSDPEKAWLIYAGEMGVSNLLVENTEVVGAGVKARNGSMGVSAQGITLRRVNIHGVAIGFSAMTNSVIEESYIHDLQAQYAQGGRGTPVHFGVEVYSDKNVVIRNNTIEVPPSSDAAILVEETDNNQQTGVRVENNRLLGGQRSLQVNGFYPEHPLNVLVSDNRMTSATRLLFHCNPNVNLSGKGNVQDDTSDPVSLSPCQKQA